MKFQDSLEQNKKMQEEFNQAQENLAKNEYKGFSNGGLVEILISGACEVKYIKIDPSALSDIEQLEAIIIQAFNSALKKANIVSPNKIMNLMNQYLIAQVAQQKK